MNQTIIGLFETTAQAHKAVDALKKEKFTADQVSVIAGDKVGNSDVQAMLEGVGEPDINFYKEGVRRGGTLVVVNTTQDKLRRAADILNRFEMVDIDSRTSEYGYRLRETTDQDLVLPVVEEQLQVGKRAVERGRMRVYTRVTERPVEEQVRLREERVNVERRPVDRAVTDADMAAMRDQSFEVTAMAEEAVVSKQARVVEEVVVDKQVNERTETVRDTVRRTDVQVDETGGQARTGATATSYETYDKDYRTYFSDKLGKSGYTYEQYTPVFRYGHSLAENERYRGRNWDQIEADARRDWETSNPNTWDQFKESVRYAWDRATGKRA